MHILEIDRDGEQLLQGFVRAEWPDSADMVAGRAASWIRLFLRSAALWSQARPLSAAVRVSVAPGQPLVTVHSFVVPRAQEQRLRLVLAAFMRTDRMGPGLTEGPVVGEELAGRFIHPDEPRVGLRREVLSGQGGLAIHHNIRLADQLPRLLQTFADLGLPFAYEMQAAPWELPRELLRQVLHGQSMLAHATGVPQRLIADQAAFAARLHAAAFHIEECIATPSPHHVDAVGDTLSRLMDDTVYATLGAPPRVEPLADTLAEAFAHHVHSHAMLGAASAELAEAAAAATREEVDRCLACRSLGHGLPEVEPAGAEPLAIILGGMREPPTPPAPGTGSTSPSTHAVNSRAIIASGGNPFLFVSYARADRDVVYPVVDSLAGAGASLWIDRRLIGGDDWLAELEAQLMRCTGVLAFVSPAFASSRYCQREVRFGDTLSKTIIPVYLAPVELGGGLSFILHGVQRVELPSGQNLEAIVAAMRAHVPGVLALG